jgi:hypothetical protein
MILIETRGKPATDSRGGFSRQERDALVTAILTVFLR